jgi:hypothetical protein
VNGDYFKRFLFGEFRKNCGHTPRQHCFPSAWWAYKKRIVPSGSGYLERALRCLLTDNIGEVSPIACLARSIGFGPRRRQLSGA